MKTQIKYPKDKALGVLFGTFIGDALGRPFEGAAPIDENQLLKDIPENYFPRFYTDDTQMAISVFEEMAEHGNIDNESLKNRFLRRFDPLRGYSAGIFKLINEWENGTDVDTAAKSQFRGKGSFGNGAAMRVAPVSLFFEINEQSELFETVKLSSEVTHTHPLGIQGAQLQAFAVLLALNDVPQSEWLGHINEVSLDNVYRIKLDIIKSCLQKSYNSFEAAALIGNGIEALEAVPAALYSFLRKPLSFPEAVIGAISLGGDADTIGAMAGAISGARVGFKGMPEEWLWTLENRKEGKDFIVSMVEKYY